MSGYELYFYQGLHAFEIFHGQPIDEGLLRAGAGGRMKFSIATVSIGGSLTEKLAAIAAAGFDGVEIFEADVLAHEGSPREIGALVRDHGLEVVAFQPFRDFEGMPEPQRARGFERAKRKFELMNELGAGRILICSNVSPASLGGIDRAAADLRELGEVAEGFGIDIGFEALAWGRHVSDYRDAWEIVRRADHPRVGLILDSWHSLAPRTALRPDPRHPGRPHHLRAARRRAADGDGPAAMVAALPQLPRPGRPAGRRTSWGRSRRPATTAGSRSRSSTTASAWPRRGGSPRTASGR